MSLSLLPKSNHMQIEIQKTVIEFKEIELPAYFKNSCHFFKIYSNTKCLKACALEDYLEIEQTSSDLAFRLNGTEPSTKEEFEEQYSAVLTKLNSFV